MLNPETLLIRSGEGAAIAPFTTDKITPAQTSGDFGIREVNLPPGQALPETIDTVNNAAATILQGQVAFQIGDLEPILADPRSTVILPRGMHFTARAVGDEAARYMVLYGPATGRRDRARDYLTWCLERARHFHQGELNAEQLERWCGQHPHQQWQHSPQPQS